MMEKGIFSEHSSAPVPLLEVRQLGTEFFSKRSSVPGVRDLTFSLEKGKVLGLAGESGCGKSISSLAIMGLLPVNARICRGKILFKGEDLQKLSKEEWAGLRGSRVSMIFQDSLTSLNPVLRIGRQLEEVFLIHKNMDRRGARREAIAMLRRVGIPSPEQRFDSYPHELSGGMRQRVMIAMAFACSPELLIADEPTTALDVTIQDQILRELKRLKESTGTAVLFITHDFGLMAEMADDLLVMYAGEGVEYGDGDSIFDDPLHPYTKGLLNSIPRLDRSVDRLVSIKGSVPALGRYYQGCPFADRCPHPFPQCGIETPPRVQIGKRWVLCWEYQGRDS
jgi:peptide/nickel transport system ATP-binding protein/oligopeptide transport system ATP-binding protein